jgi:phenylalanine-4-hydroxylase
MSDNTKSPNDQQSAYEKAAQNEEIDPRCIPIKLEATPPVGDDITYPEYPDDDHDTWKILYNRQFELLRDRACDEFLLGHQLLEVSPEKIPALKNLSRKLYKKTQWQVARIPGLLHETDFFDMLKNGIFPSTDYIRSKKELDYTPAPDMFHDIFGHMPLITQPSFANFYRYFGQIAARAEGAYRRRLERIYWFTVEFGLIQTGAGPRIYGAGILSSPGEVVHSLTDKVEKHPFDPEVVSETEYDVWHLQDKLFIIEGFEKLENDFRMWVKANRLDQSS